MASRGIPSQVGEMGDLSGRKIPPFWRRAWGKQKRPKQQEEGQIKICRHVNDGENRRDVTSASRTRARGHKQGPGKVASSPADVNLCYGPEEKVCSEQGVAPESRTPGEVW